MQKKLTYVRVQCKYCLGSGQVSNTIPPYECPECINGTTLALLVDPYHEALIEDGTEWRARVDARIDRINNLINRKRGIK